MLRLHAVASAHEANEVVRQIEECIPQIENYCYGATLLHHFSGLGRWEVVTFLLERGARASVFDDMGRTPKDIAQENSEDGLSLVSISGSVIDYDKTVAILSPYED